MDDWVVIRRWMFGIGIAFAFCIYPFLRPWWLAFACHVGFLLYALLMVWSQGWNLMEGLIIVVIMGVLLVMTVIAIAGFRKPGEQLQQENQDRMILKKSQPV